ncbi:MAG TPA: energy transducer TonB [Chthoniobacterales bacterium]|nr:energy transducer TonB [Chthoniobacterales bacterium]
MRARLITGILAGVACSSIFAEREVERPASRRDVVHMVSPRYPHKLQASRIGGTGVFRMAIDFKTGKVTKVAVVKSTGSDPLDREAVFALRQWRFKPGRLSQADMPITFQADGIIQLPTSARLLRNR